MAEGLTAAQRVGRQVRVALVEQGRTQGDVASALGIAHQALSRRMLGQVSFRADELILIADLLGVDAARFLRPVPEPRARDEPKSDRATSASGAAA